MVFSKHQKKVKNLCVNMGVFLSVVAYNFPASAGSDVFLSINRSSVIELKEPSKEIVVANPDIADIYANNPHNLTIIGKTAGKTNIRLFNAEGKLTRTIDVSVGYDLPSIRKALKTFIPEEKIAVEMVNTSIALSGNVRNNATTEKALKIVQEYIANSVVATSNPTSSSSAGGEDKYPKILNMMKIISGQQVMLRVRVAEVNRDALKKLGFDVNYMASGSAGSLSFGTGGGLSSIFTAIGATALPAGSFTTSIDSNDVRGAMVGHYTTGSGDKIGGLAKALERDGLIKTLAEPNLVAVSGEQAEFLAGGEVPILTPSSGGTGVVTTTIEYKPYGVSVKFSPDVLSENRIRMTVQPEVSEISDANSIILSGFKIPSITTRRAKTTVELAPGESFMIAGLIKDHTAATIDQLPGVKDLPVLGALFRSTEFQRNESELVISVTPYLVDPLKSSDIKLPTDDFRPASQIEMFFFGALGAITADGKSVTKTPELEGSTGFMVE